eukprot:2954723-Rhodomonas_salina.3
MPPSTFELSVLDILQRRSPGHGSRLVRPRASPASASTPPPPSARARACRAHARQTRSQRKACLLYTSDAADDM